MSSRTLQRRRFLQIAATTAASGATVSCSRRPGGRVLKAAELRAVEAIAGRLIPADQDPGAIEAGVATYIDRQLAGILKKHTRTYRLGLVGVNHVAWARFRKHFTDLSAAQQDEVLSALEAGGTDPKIWPPAQARAFFELVRDHVMQGYYGDPRHGGNREYASWLMLGVPPAPIRGRRIYDLATGAADEDRRNKPWR